MKQCKRVAEPLNYRRFTLEGYLDEHLGTSMEMKKKKQNYCSAYEQALNAGQHARVTATTVFFFFLNQNRNICKIEIEHLKRPNETKLTEDL